MVDKNNELYSLRRFNSLSLIHMMEIVTPYKKFQQKDEEKIKSNMNNGLEIVKIQRDLNGKDLKNQSGEEIIVGDGGSAVFLFIGEPADGEL